MASDIPQGVSISLRGPDHAAVEAAANELKERFGKRFAVCRRSVAPVSSGGGLTIRATLLVSAEDHLDAAVAASLDLFYSGSRTGLQEA
ncbi:conserved protein of unknown function [Rhodovastum atsumiense]|uniref:Uncharacterized protein n=1 Tax=Rhodovastum atsumiense TaxID=504468 RepID=A0A5M6IZY2_9PROT|nr:hypothetical protein [Rhodovastum atsumiense]KAA5613906.1 hypothetical protein F1189_03785 [Rhodovastum atsumiense]CAH2602034.1 conserved protein of unknown function [Rhodovastum atsumiense]